MYQRYFLSQLEEFDHQNRSSHTSSEIQRIIAKGSTQSAALRHMVSHTNYIMSALVTPLSTLYYSNLQYNIISP